MAGPESASANLDMSAVTMNVWLVQHGLSEPKEKHPERPLAPDGRREVRSMAAALAKLGLQVGAIWHSGKLRARETAEILAADLQPAGGVLERSGLAPLDDPTSAASEIDASEIPVMLVGHLPHLSRLAALLVTGQADREIVSFRNAGVVCLGKEADGWRIRWILTPDTALR